MSNAMMRFWTARLSQPIRLECGDRELVTLRDCVDYLGDRFEYGAHLIVLEGIYIALQNAAEAGRPEDIAFAAKELRHFLKAQALI